jgi:hypothetical protein
MVASPCGCGAAVALEHRREDDGAQAGMFQELPTGLSADQFKLPVLLMQHVMCLHPLHPSDGGQVENFTIRPNAAENNFVRARSAQQGRPLRAPRRFTCGVPEKADSFANLPEGPHSAVEISEASDAGTGVNSTQGGIRAKFRCLGSNKYGLIRRKKL